MSGPKRRQHDAMRKRHASPLTWQRSATYRAWSLRACTHVKSLLLLHTKLASLATRTASFDTAHHHRMRARVIRPYLIPATCAASHLDRCLNGFDSYSVLAITSRVCICIRVAVQRRTVAAAVSLRVVARCGARCPAMATMQ